jgi:Raf kinase inhibitor-like YbhB/YbcL family protein
MELKVTSSAFKDGGMIPPKYTCDGEDISPALEWPSVPEQTRSLVLIADDPDAPRGTFVHWVLYNLPADTRKLPDSVKPEETLANSARQGTNDFGETGYNGPCPPGGTHRYFFKLYALDAPVNLPPGARKADLLQAMRGHILAEGQLVGKYKR